MRTSLESFEEVFAKQLIDPRDRWVLDLLPPERLGTLWVDGSLAEGMAVSAGVDADSPRVRIASSFASDCG